MRAVVFDGPYKVSLQDRPIPEIQDPKDIVVRVTYTALCGSELHVFRGHQAVSYLEGVGYGWRPSEEGSWGRGKRLWRKRLMMW